jgi:hypothetical protein
VKLRLWRLLLHRCLLLVAASTMLAPTAAAQAPITCPVSEFANLWACIQPGQKIEVRTLDHKKKTGTLKAVDGSHLALRLSRVLHRETIQLTAAEIDTIWVSRGIGRAASTAVGAVGGFSFGLLISGQMSEEPDAATTALVAATVGGGVLGWLSETEELVIAFTSDPKRLSRAPHYAAEAPPVPSSLPALVARDFAASGVRRGDDVRVALADGSRLRGEVMALDDDALLLDTAEHRVTQVRQADVDAIWRKVHQPPSLTKGAVAGAVVGAILMGMVSLYQVASDVPPDSPDHLSVGDEVAFIGFTTGIGMLATRFMGHREQLIMVRPLATPGVTRPTGVVVQWTLYARGAAPGVGR